MCERTVFVSGLQGDAKVDDLHIYFQSKKKSNGGDVEKIDYNPDTGIAKVLFADSQAATRVASKQHNLKGSTLTVKMSNDQEEDMSSSVLVRGISDNTTEDALQNYFENKRRSSGGDVKKIKRLNNSQAVVTFESSEIAKRVLEWGKHTLDDHLLTVTKIKPDPPKKATPTSAEVPVTEEKSHTVRVTGISPKTTKDALLNFFENRRRSGGGEIEDIQYKQDEGLAEIFFCSAEDAENVSQKEDLKLDGVKLGLALKELPKVLPKDPCKLHVIGLSEKTTKDGFLSFIEVVSGEEVQSMLFGSNFNVMVTFEEPPDLEKIQQKCRKRPLDGSHLQIEQVSICDCIEVSGLGSKTTRDTILYYFENPRKSGGGDVKKVEFVDGETKALVFFEEPSVVDRVVTHEHVMNGETLQVVPHQPFLGEPSKEPGGGKKEKQFNADPQVIAFIEKFFQKEFEELLQGNEVKLNQEQGKDEVVLVAINNKIDKAKWDESCAVIEKYINEITTREVAVSSAAWKETIQQAKLRFSTAEDKIDILYKEKEKRILLRGKKQDVDTLAEQLEDLSKEIDKKIDYEKAKVTNKMDLTKPQLDMLNFIGATEHLMGQFKDLEVKIDKNSSVINFRGPDSVVKEGNISIWQYLSKMKDQEMELPRSVVSILTSDAGIVFLYKQFRDQNIEAVINSSDGNDDTRLIVTAVDRRDVNKAVDLIKEMTIEDSVPLDQDQNSLILSDKWKKLVDNFKTSMLLKVAIDPGSNSICIAGIKEQVNEAKEQVLDFLEENTIINITVGAEAGHIKYLLRFQQDEVKKIEDELKHHSLHILQDSNEEGFTIRGTKKGTKKASKKVLQLVNQIKDKSIEIEKQGIKKLFSESKGKKLLSNIENDHTCIIEHWSPFDEKNMNTAGSATVAASQAQQVCSYVTPEGKNIILLKGDLTEFKVDVMVNAANGQLQHIGGLARAIVVKGGKEIQDECDDYISRNNDLLDGEVFVSKPGKLPCKRLVHAVGPKWNTWSKQYREEESKEERILAQTVFNALEKANNFTNIGIPAISAGVFGFPIGLCAKTMLESVLAYSKEKPHVKLTEIYIIDMNDNVIQAFSKEMRKRFSKDKTFTDGAKKGPTKETVGNIPRGKRRSVAKDDPPSSKTSSSPVEINDAIPGIKIDIIVGDLAKEEAHAIVNTVASDLDLSKNPCAKALSNAAGPRLQQECQGKGPLRAGDVVVTEGYSLGCKNVFHVTAGSWQSGKGERVMRALLVSCLKEADNRGFLSIAFPAIGTGNLGFPRDVVARIFFDEVNDFKKKHPQTSVLEVHFVLFHLDKPTIDAFHNEQKNWGKPTKGKRRSQPFQGIRKEPDDTPMGEANDDIKNAFIGSVRVDLVPGDITKESTDAIVTASNASLDISRGGGVGAAIAKAGGPSIQKECKMLGPQVPGSVVCTSAGNLPSRKLFHLVSASYRPGDMTDVILECLKIAEREEIRSIAIPAVGTGNASISAKEAAKALLKAVGKFCKTKSSSLQHIRIVVFQEHMLKDFHKAIEELEKNESSSGSSWGIFSWLKSLIYGGGDKKEALGLSNVYVDNFDGMAVGKGSFSPHRQMCLKVFAFSDSILKKADAAIKELIKDQFKRKVIDKPAIEGLSPTQEERILRLQGKYFTEIDIQKRSARIIISGLSEDVSDTACAIYEILNEKTEAEHERRYAELVAKTVQWYYIEDGKKEPYDDMINSKIEKAYKENKDSVMVNLYDENNKALTYRIVFATMKETNIDTRDKTDVYREEQGTGIPLPQQWDSQPKDTKGKEKDLHLVQLDPAKNKQEYDRVQAAITKSSPINIVKIERVQNPELYRAYMVKKQKMDDKDGGNEKKLFHGTPVSTCELVNHKGFNRSYCGKNATVYGKGVYFARDASYSTRPTYSPPDPNDPNGYRCMYLASVLVGQFAVGNQNMIAPPPKDPNSPTVTYDTTVDNANDPQVFVAFHDNQVYPDYLITFQ